MRRKSLIMAVGLAAAAATVLGACSSSGGGGNPTNPNSSTNSSSSSSPNGVEAAFNAAVDNVVNPSTKTGGTLNLGATSDCDSWDPKIAYYGWCWNMQRLYNRSLIGYQDLNGTKFTLAPDLATDMGTHNADYSV